MTEFSVTRAHLKNACDQRQWDLLDRLLEIDASGIDDKSLFTDTWGSWWGMLLECVMQKQIKGVQVLLARGAEGDRQGGADVEAARVRRVGGVDDVGDAARGAIGEIRIYRRALSHPEVAHLAVDSSEER